MLLACIECVQDEEEQMNTKLNEADGQEADRGPEKAKKASGAVVSLIQGLSGKNRLADAESFKPNVDLSKVINKPALLDSTNGRFHQSINQNARPAMPMAKQT